MQAAADGVRQGHRALVGQAGERLGWMHRLEVMRGGRGRQSADLDGQHAIRAATAADLEQVLQVLDRLGGPQQREGALELVDPHHLSQVSADERDAVVRCELALPAVWLDLERLTQRRRHSPLTDARVLLGRCGRGRELVHPLLPHDDR